MISTPVATLRKTITKGNRRRIMRRTPKSYTRQSHIEDTAPDLANLIDCQIKFVQKHPGGPSASLRVPIDSCLGFFERRRVDSQ
jgi:hypothetical protein